jgi:hypothetical protein
VAPSSLQQVALLDVPELLENQSKRVVVADVENLFFVAEVVVEISRRHLEGSGDLIDARAVVATPSKDGGCSAKDLDPFALAARSLAVHEGTSVPRYVVA